MILSMTYWLLKTEAGVYSWDQLVAEKKTWWTGVRNYQARNNLRAMKRGDIAFIYHSGDERMIVGVAHITAEATPEATTDAGDWVAVEVEGLKPLAREVGLEEIRNTPILSGMELVRHSRLSVVPVREPEAKMILKIGKTDV
jgi:predicted RNA-binding protein with PUA-like domain